jgi:hypothetical protein
MEEKVDENPILQKVCSFLKNIEGCFNTNNGIEHLERLEKFLDQDIISPLLYPKIKKLFTQIITLSENHNNNKWPVSFDEKSYEVRLFPKIPRSFFLSKKEIERYESAKERDNIELYQVTLPLINQKTNKIYKIWEIYFTNELLEAIIFHRCNNFEQNKNEFILNKIISMLSRKYNQKRKSIILDWFNKELYHYFSSYCNLFKDYFLQGFLYFASERLNITFSTEELMIYTSDPYLIVTNVMEHNSPKYINSSNFDTNSPEDILTYRKNLFEILRNIAKAHNLPPIQQKKYLKFL